MKIKQVSCTQFAGIRDRAVTFADGINVVCGKNESGKSTLVNLLSRTLFQNVRLDKRSDKEFFELYFPGRRKGSAMVGDFADGKVVFEADGSTYTLSKEWGADARCILTSEEGAIRDPGTIGQILKQALVYGEGVYSEMLFSSQRNADLSLQTLLDASKKTATKQEITDAVSQAFAESDGIGADKIEQAIANKIEEIAGKHWDLERRQPVRKAGRWVNGLGEILKAYYAMEDAKGVLEELSRLEQEADRAASDYAEKDHAAHMAEEAYHQFNAFASRLAVQHERKKAMDRMERELLKITDVLSKWPELGERLEKAKKLQKERDDRNVLDLRNFVKEARAELSAEDLAAAQQPCPSGAEIAKAEAYRREITKLENKLCGMNIHADISMLGGNEVRVISLRTGERVDVSGGAAAITEAVKIVIDGVMEMKLSPADVDVAAVKTKIAQIRADMDEIFAQYHVSGLEELEACARMIGEAQGKIERVNAKIARVLGSVSIEQLEERYGQIGPVDRSKEEIDAEIRTLCGSADLAMFIAKAEAVIDGYAAEYGSINDLKAKAFDLETERKKAMASLSEGQDIPAEYLGIADPENHLEQLQQDLRLKQSRREAAFAEKASAAGRLDAYQDVHPEDCREEAEKAERKLEEVSLLLDHWLHIARVFQKQKEAIRNDPMQDIAERFAYYLGVISDGAVSSEFPERDKLNMQIYSRDRLLDYGKLSEGTKETVSLAFRLAVLDHLFPEGGGVIVFDDPFTDMDAERTKQACELIRQCAQRHQVIFLTCSEHYLEQLQGNHILL